MMEEGNSIDEGETEAPKKIALKVPSLFIKGSSPTKNSKDEQQPPSSNGEETPAPPKKPSRPMPASLKKKLDEAKAHKTEEDKPESEVPAPLPNGNDTTRTNSEETSTPTPPPKKPSRPMPASARKKLEVSSPTGEEKTNSFEDTPEPNDITPKKSKPMPASARKKVEGSSSKPEDSDEVTSPPPEKAMPASAKRKLEESDSGGEEENGKSDDVSDKEDDNGKDDQPKSLFDQISASIKTSSTSSVRKTGPASARKKLEKSVDKSGSDEKYYSAEEDEDIERKRNVNGSLPSSDPEKNSEEEEKEPDATTEGGNPLDDKSEAVADAEPSQDSKKIITLGVGGIKFPTFKKPMPASVMKKMEDKKKKERKHKEEDQDEIDVSSETKTDSKSEDNIDEESKSFSTRRSRSGLSKELMSLTDEMFRCQYCDYETFTLSAKNKHEEGHFKVKDPSTSTPKEPSEKKKSSSSKPEMKYKDICPYCSRRISNQRKLNKHASACGRRLKLRCKICNKQCKSQADFDAHNHNDSEQKHSGAGEMGTDNGKNISPPLEQEENFNQSSPPSPSSVKAKSIASSDSGENKLDESSSKTSDQSSKSANSFKQKIADVLSNLDSKKRKAASDDEEEDKDAPPPSKKPDLSDSRSKGKKESFEGKSVRQKLEDRGSVSATDRKSTKDLHDLECEVCHRVFSQMSHRQRHERNVHSIRLPRGYCNQSSSTSSTPTETKTEKAAEPLPPAKSKTKLSIYLEDVPVSGGGSCPVCRKYIATRLRRHVQNVHKLKSRSESNSTVFPKSKPVKPLVRPSAPKSYKIYRSSADKAKKKLVSTKPTKKEEVSPYSHSSSEGEENVPPPPPPPPPPKPKEKKKEVTSSVLTPTPTTALPTDFRCGCCDQLFTVRVDFNEHMTRRHPKQKRLVACKLCMHMFTHEEDFILHIQFRHKELVSGMTKSNANSKHPPKKPEPPPPQKKPSDEPSRSSKSSVSGPPKSSHSNHSNTHGSSSSFSRKSSRRGSNVNPTDFNAAAIRSCPKVTVKISDADKTAAEKVLRRLHRRKQEQKSSSSGKTSRKSTSKPHRPRTPSPTPMDYDDGPASPPAMDVDDDEEESAGIAITATFSQRTSPGKSGPASVTASSALRDDLNKMPCSTCPEVFYSFEALRKHELYFHNVKTSKMCPICGVYPTKLSRHLLAHENKTVRCSCAPCRINFADFGQLLKHNLEFHPGPDGGALTAPNRKMPVETPEKKDQDKSKESQSSDELFRCKLCKKEMNGGATARRHVRRVHAELADDAEKYVEQVEKEEEKVEEEKDDFEMSSILEDTNKKLQDSSWGDDDDNDYAEDIRAPSPSPPPSPPPPPKSAKPVRAMPASIRAKLAEKKKLESDTSRASSPETSKPKPTSTPKPKRVGPMPASVRAKLEKKKEEPTTSEVKPPSSEYSSSSKPSKPRPMPASVRAKLTTQSSAASDALSDSGSRKSSTSNSSKPSKPRPMPASVRAKLMTQPSAAFDALSDSGSRKSSTSNSSKTSKPRPMPASARARMLNKAELKEVAAPQPPEDSYSPAHSPEPIDFRDDYSNHGQTEETRAASDSHEVVTLDDDDDDVAIIEDTAPDPTPSFNIADEIAEHNRAVQMAMGEVPTGSQVAPNVSYKCKLCSRAFDTGDGIRRHIRRGHEEYGPEHTENLIETVYEEPAPPSTANHTSTSSSNLEANRRRRLNVNYHKTYAHLDEEDVEEEVIVSRGTSTRPRGIVTMELPSTDPPTSSSPAISHSVDNTEGANAPVLMFACKFCGKRMETSSKVKWHITKAHRGMKGLYEDEVIYLEPGKEDEFVPLLHDQQKMQMLKQPPTIAPPAPEMPPPVAYKCRICQKTLEKRASLLQHLYRSHPEVKTGLGQGEIVRFVQDVYENNLLNSAMTDMEGSKEETYTCGFCSFQTSDEHDWARHYKKHTGVSPYHCQYCSAGFSRQHQLTAHITREHTGAEFLNEDEAEISMEEMVGVGEISVSTANRIQIEPPKVISLRMSFSSGGGGETYSNAGGADHQEEDPISDPVEPDYGDEADGGNNEGEGGDANGANNEEEESQSFPMPYQGDLSSLFPTLGGVGVPGSLADIDGGMDLD